MEQNKRTNKQYSVRQLLLACLLTALATAAVLLGAAYLLAGGGEGLAFLSKLQTVGQLIEREYVGETDLVGLADGAAAGMVSATGDRWSYYMTAQEYEDYQNRGNNVSSGIGVTITPDEAIGGFAIVSVTEGSPAAAAGVEAGQVITGAAGQDVRGLTTAELKALISAQEGEFPLELINPDGSTVTRTVYRDNFYTNPVRYELLEGDIGYIAIANFEAGAAENAKDAVEQLRGQGAQSLIFDVRSNPGGRLSELISLLDYLLPEGELFVSVDKSGKEEVYTSDAACVELPMVVLLNAGSYSAAEFFAAALREYEAAVLIGEASTGKGRSQMTYELSDGSAVHISTNRYLTPNRVDLSEVGGLVPDIAVEMGPEGDTQLDEATKYLS